MKSPSDLAAILARQWNNANYREERLLNSDAWPMVLNIGKPSADSFEIQLESMRSHVMAWRQVSVGKVRWQSLRFRKLGDPVDFPIAWELHKPSEWIKATGERSIEAEFQRLSRFVDAAPPSLHNFLIRQRHAWLDKADDDVLLALKIAQQLQPGCAQGAPLRALGIGGADSKFYERNRNLVTKLLDIHFSGLPSELGLESFLGAASDHNHWLLLVDLGGDLLPYRQLRVRDTELLQKPLPGRCLLVVENERCYHQLPMLPDTVAILGAGLNLAWLSAPWIREKNLAYWGDLDTWGLTMLARARQLQPHLLPVLMTREVFEQSCEKSVAEIVNSSRTPPQGLSEVERTLFNYLLAQKFGRLEQEFIARDVVEQALLQWRKFVQ